MAQETISYKVINNSGKEVGTVQLDKAVFGSAIFADLVHQTVRWQRAKRRSGTHASLNRGRMEGGGKKPHAQKHTGRARAGSNNSPLWVGGAKAHGPQPRSYEFRLAKRVKAQALASVLTDKVNKKELYILDNIKNDSGKTKDIVAMLKAIGISGKTTVIIGAERDEGTIKSYRNIAKITNLPAHAANVYDIIKAKAVVVAQQSLEELTARVKGGAA
jgi:large subunit ribosomal protein L4